MSDAMGPDPGGDAPKVIEVVVTAGGGVFFPSGTRHVRRLVFDPLEIGRLLREPGAGASRLAGVRQNGSCVLIELEGGTAVLLCQAAGDGPAGESVARPTCGRAELASASGDVRRRTS